MQFIYLALAVLTSGYSGVSYKKLSVCSGNRSTSFLLPVFWYIPLTLVFGVCALCSGESFHWGVVLPALLAGVAYTACAFSLLESMKANSFSLTIIITNLSFIFPVVLSLVFLQESAHPLQLIGMLLAVAVIVMMNVGKKEGKSSLPSILLAVVSSLGNGVINFAIKIQQHYMPGEGRNSFFFFSYLFASIFCCGVYLLYHCRGQRMEISRDHRRIVLFNAAALAMCNGVCFFATGMLTGMMNAAAEFTVITSLSIVVSLAIGYVQMHKRLTKREVSSLLICTVAIACQYFNLL